MKVISVLNTKGGVGKTTISIHLAMALHREQNSVLFIDSDPQGSARDWAACREGPGFVVVGVDRPTLQRDIPVVGAGYDYVIIDGVPQLQAMLISAVRASGTVIIPVQPSPYDIRATENLVELVKLEQERRPLEAFLLLSMQRGATRLCKESRIALNQFDIPVLENGTTHRVAYGHSAKYGMTVFEVEPDGPAAAEIMAIKNEIFQSENEHEDQI